MLPELSWRDLGSGVYEVNNNYTSNGVAQRRDLLFWTRHREKRQRFSMKFAIGWSQIFDLLALVVNQRFTARVSNRHAQAARHMKYRYAACCCCAMWNLSSTNEKHKFKIDMTRLQSTWQTTIYHFFGRKTCLWKSIRKNTTPNTPSNYQVRILALLIISGQYHFTRRI